MFAAIDVIMFAIFERWCNFSRLSATFCNGKVCNRPRPCLQWFGRARPGLSRWTSVQAAQPGSTCLPVFPFLHSASCEGLYSPDAKSNVGTVSRVLSTGYIFSSPLKKGELKDSERGLKPRKNRCMYEALSLVGLPTSGPSIPYSIFLGCDRAIHGI
jgi:hypothetical protein